MTSHLGRNTHLLIYFRMSSTELLEAASNSKILKAKSSVEEASLTVDLFGQYPSTGSFSNPAGSTKQKRLGELIGFQAVF